MASAPQLQGHGGLRHPPDRLERSPESTAAPTVQGFPRDAEAPGTGCRGRLHARPLHAWMDIEAMKAGKHVISAVPAGMSVEELEQMLETVKSTGLRYMMAETSYYRPEIMTCREWARQGRFGTIFYSEAEYHHEGLLPLMFDDRGLPTWRHGFPPMHYPTHCTGMVIPVTGERLTEVQAIGWGDGHEILQTNQYSNPFWNTTAFFKTSGGHSSRVSVFWHVAAGGTERGAVLRRPHVLHHGAARRLAQHGGARSARTARPCSTPTATPKATSGSKPTSSRTTGRDCPNRCACKSGHGGSHTFITHEFISAILEERHPAVDIWEAIAYTLPGIVAHQSALKGGEPMKIRDYGKPA